MSADPSPGRVLITGGGAVSPFGAGVAVLLERMRAGRSAIRPFRPAGRSDRRPTLAALVDTPLDAPPGDVPGAASAWRRLDRLARMALLAAHEALRSAGIPPPDRAGDGLVLGTTTAGVAPLADYLDTLFAEGPDAVSPMLFPGTVPNAPASQCSILLGLKGPNLTLCSMEASGLAAIATAAGLIRSGAADRIVAGGADEYPPAIDRAWRALRIVAREGAVPPVGSSEGRAGRFAPGEGAYFVVLESGEEAGGRGAVPWCAVRRVEVSHRSCEPHRRPVVAESGWPIRSAIGECGAASAAAALMAALSIRDRIPPPPGSSSGPGAGEVRFPVRAAGAGGADVTVVLEPAGD